VGGWVGRFFILIFEIEKYERGKEGHGFVYLCKIS